MAARLAERGLRVLVLERGPWWGPAHTKRPPEEHRAFPRGWSFGRFLRNVRMARSRRSHDLVVHSDGLFEVHLFERLTTLAGSGVGGGSLVYTSILERPEAEYFAAFPPEVTGEEMSPFYDRVIGVLRPEPAPEPTEKRLAFERAVRDAGLGPARTPALAVAFGESPTHRQEVVNAAGVAQGTCTYRGECIVGCPERAKTTLDLTYVPLALRAGAHVRALTEVVAIGRENRTYVVQYVDRARHETGEVRAERLVLCAGTLNTLRLLFAARHANRLPGLPQTLGHGFSTNGDIGVALLRSPRLHAATRGPSIESWIAGSSNGAPYFIAECDLPTHVLPFRWLGRLAERSAVLLGMGRDASTGEVTFDGNLLRTSVDRSMDAELFEAIERAETAIGDRYEPRRTTQLRGPTGGRLRVGTVHPLGGAAMAQGPDAGVVDHTGRVFGEPGLYIADGTIVPRATGVPPSLTIAALAERTASLVA